MWEPKMSPVLFGSLYSFLLTSGPRPWGWVSPRPYSPLQEVELDQGCILHHPRWHPRASTAGSRCSKCTRVPLPAHLWLGMLPPPASRVYRQNKNDTKRKPTKINREGKLRRGEPIPSVVKSTTLLSTVIWHCWRFVLITFNKIQSKDDCLGSLSNKALSLITILYYQ